MEIKLHKKDSTYVLYYKDVIDRRKLNIIIKPHEFLKLKSLFIKLIDIHQNNKILSGDCLTIDKNYLLKSKDIKIIIKPNKNSEHFDCIDKWIYGLELKN